MCGISGVWGTDNDLAVRAMVAAMTHRGPDDAGVYHDAQVALGMTRLAILDISMAGHQPMKTPDGTIWIVYNGEIYNFQSERRLLETKGYAFSSHSDTEVVLRMYEHYGDDFLLRLRGIFALAIYDKRPGPGHERLLLARDHLGVKPLLFTRVGNRLAFASEMKALFASGLVEPEVDPVGLRLLLTYGSVYQPQTLVRGVSMLPPAHRLIIEGGRERIERYWRLSVDRRADLKGASYGDLIAEVSHTLEEAVRLQLVSDVPVGAFLSGGVDSSILVALMARTIGRRVKTFSVGFEAEGAEIDESDDAERIARFIGTDHTCVRVRGTEVRETIEHIAASLDQPSVDGVNSYFVSRAARRAVTVAISGTGSDEIFAGYPWFIHMALSESAGRESDFWRSLARSFLAAVARRPVFDPLLLVRSGTRMSRARNDGADFVVKYANNYQVFGPLGAARLVSPRLRRAAQAGRSQYYDLSAIDEVAAGSVIQRVTGLCLRGYTNNQLLSTLR